MRSLRKVGTLALTALVAVACEDITNPVEEFGQLAGPYVRFERSSAVGVPGSVVRVIFQMPTRVEEDVDIDFTFGGSARFGEDFWAVDDEGNVRTDVTGAGGSARIPYRAEQTQFGRDTLNLFVPFNATDGRTAEIEITSARTASGRTVETGFVESFRTFRLNIEGFVDITTGAYEGQMTGQLGNAATQVTITKPATPVAIDGNTYAFVISDYSAGLFGVPVPWAFNVTSGGTVLAAPRSHQFATVTSTVTGTYNFTTRQLRLNVTLTCCGAAGATWQLTVARQ
jgi:hypothetical protein